MYAFEAPPPMKAIVWDEEGWIVCSLITRWKGSRNRPSSVILHFFCLAPQRASIFRTCVSASFTDAECGLFVHQQRRSGGTGNGDLGAIGWLFELRSSWVGWHTSYGLQRFSVPRFALPAPPQCKPIHHVICPCSGGRGPSGGGVRDYNFFCQLRSAPEGRPWALGPAKGWFRGLNEVEKLQN